MRVLLVLALFLAAGLAQNTCQRPLAGQQFTGKYPNVAQLSPVLRNPLAGETVTITFTGASEAVTESSSLISFSANWDINNLILNVRYSDADSETLDTAEYGCESGVNGVYQVKWSDFCTKLVIDVVQDNCYARRVKYNGLVLTRVVPTCDLLDSRENLWNGVYDDFNPEGNEFSSLAVQFVVRPGHSERDVLEQSARGTRKSNWKLDGKGHLLVYDVSSRPKWASCGDRADAGIYLINWSDNCSKFELALVSDSCRGRRELYHTMSVSKGGVDIPRSYSSAATTLPSFLALALSLLAVVLL